MKSEASPVYEHEVPDWSPGQKIQVMKAGVTLYYRVWDHGLRRRRTKGYVPEIGEILTYVGWRDPNGTDLTSEMHFQTTTNIIGSFRPNHRGIPLSSHYKVIN